MQSLTVPQGSFQLSRYPARRDDPLRAWDAADEYLLEHLAERAIQESIKDSIKGSEDIRCLVVNDSFGALATALAEYRPQLWSDSYLAHQAALANLQKNQCSADQVTLLTSVEEPTGIYDLVVIKIPKSLALLEDQLCRLRPHVDENTRVVGAAMVKAIHTSTLKLFERILGETKTSLAKKKARLIFSTIDTDDSGPVSTSPYPKSPYPKSYGLENTDYSICNHANVFSREKLDIGTRFFLEHLPSSENYKHIIDLACGNGVVGLMAAAANPNADITFTDESFMALASALDNFEAAFPDRSPASYVTANCLEGFEENSVELILNNPPFHQQNAIGDHIAWQMFNDAKKTLKIGGELWVIGNRHLNYHIKLKRLFTRCQTVASNKKFVILKAVKS